MGRREPVTVAGVVVSTKDTGLWLDVFEVDGDALEDSRRVFLPWSEVELDDTDPEEGDEVEAAVPWWLADDRDLI